MAGSMERLYELPPRIIHELDEELPVGVLGLDNWGYVTMGPDRNPDSMPSDGWGLYHPPEYYYYMDPPSATTTPATTNLPGATKQNIRTEKKYDVDFELCRSSISNSGKVRFYQALPNKEHPY